MRELHRHLERIDSVVFLILPLDLLHCFLYLLCTLRFSRSALATRNTSRSFLISSPLRELAICSHNLHECS